MNHSRVVTLKELPNMALKDNLREILNKLDVSTKELSRLSKVPYTTIQRILTDDNADPRISTIKPLVISLGVSSDMLIFDDDELGKNGDLEIIFREIIKLKGKDRETVKDVLKALIIQSRSRELYQ